MNRQKKKYSGWALITGASSGIGYEFAQQLAANGYDLILVSRRAELLNQLKGKLIKNNQVQVKVISLDLTESGSFDKLVQQTSHLDIGLVIPNAGIEANGLFHETDLALNEKVIRLNIEIPMKLANHFGAIMGQRKDGGILFVSSLFGYQGVPFVANYAATKAYILSLAEALHVELKPFGVDVTVISPGLTKTPMTDNMPINFNKLPMQSMTPEKVAKIGLEALGKKSTVVPGFLNKFYAWQNRLVPRSFPVNLFGFLIKRARIME